MRRDWTTYHKYLDLYFNDLYLKYNEALAKHKAEIDKQTRMIQRIQSSKKTYTNDAYIIAEKSKLIQYEQEKRSRIKRKQTNLFDYVMTDIEINALTSAINREIVIELVKGKSYTFPFRMGTLHLKYVEFSNTSIIHWPKSIANHLKLTAKYAPVLNEQYKRGYITKRQYFKKSKKYVAPTVSNRIWLHLINAGNWLYLRYKPNFAYHKKIGNYYRFRYNAYNNLPARTVRLTKDATAVTTLEYLDTHQKILDCPYLGAINKMVLVQIQNPDYKLKFMN